MFCSNMNDTKWTWKGSIFCRMNRIKAINVGTSVKNLARRLVLKEEKAIFGNYNIIFVSTQAINREKIGRNERNSIKIKKF